MEFLLKIFNNTVLIRSAELGYLDIVQELLTQEDIDINVKNILYLKISIKFKIQFTFIKFKYIFHLMEFNYIILIIQH